MTPNLTVPHLLRNVPYLASMLAIEPMMTATTLKKMRLKVVLFE